MSVFVKKKNTYFNFIISKLVLGELELYDRDLLQPICQDPRKQGLQDRHGPQ